MNIQSITRMNLKGVDKGLNRLGGGRCVCACLSQDPGFSESASVAPLIGKGLTGEQEVCFKAVEWFWMQAVEPDCLGMNPDSLTYQIGRPWAGPLTPLCPWGK